MHWDVIVIGAGSAGCAAVHELVRAGRHVLLLEAGGRDRAPMIRIPAGAWRVSPRHSWGYKAEPDPTRGGIVDDWSRGRVLGGTSSINGTVYVRGDPADYDRWSDLCGGQGGWDSATVAEIFQSMENSDLPGAQRGHTGPLHTRTVTRAHPTSEAFIAAAHNAGLPLADDYNAGKQEGVGHLQLTQRRGFRWSAADAFLRPVRGHPNLTVQLNAMVDRIEVDEARAVAVHYRLRGKTIRATASDIVLSAGTINSPKLLMLSGIGPTGELARHGIPINLDLPAVGQNLREHSIISVTFRSRVPTYSLSEGLLHKLGIAMKFALFGQGPIASAYEATCFIKLDERSASPDYQVFFTPIAWEKAAKRNELLSYRAVRATIIHSFAKSTGTVRLASSDPDAAPVINYPLFNDQTDVDSLADGLEAVRKIFAKAPLANLLDAETSPGPAVKSRAQLREYVRKEAGTACHPHGTCRMGIDDNSVVAPDLLVRGMTNLWIADASVIPFQISANLNAPSMMIGFKLGQQLARRTAP